MPGSSPPSSLSLKEAAEDLGVHYMTVYRYVRLGILPARKEGAAWVVERADVDALKDKDRAGGGNGRRSADWAGRLRTRLVAGDERGAWGVVEAALASGLAPADIYEDLLAPVMADLGQRWADGDIDIVDEHRASAVAARIVGRLGPRFSRRGRRRGTVVTATPAGDYHGLGLAVVADLLRGAQYDVVDLGPNTPAVSLARAVGEASSLVAVALSVHHRDCVAAVHESIVAVRAVQPAVPVIVGGAAVRDEAHAATLGADGYARTGREAVQVVATLVAA